jgi:hypothetical protein
MRATFLIFSILISNSLIAQSLGSWNVIDLKKSTKTKYSYQLEAQLRSLKFYQDFHYNELNFTANYKYDNNLVLSVLIGKHNTYTEGGNFTSPIVRDEFRLSVQASTVQKFGFFNLDNRYRIEQRYFVNDNSLSYRMRYRFGLKNKITKYNNLQFSNEFFLALGDKNSTFEKNRFLIGITNTFSKRYEVQLNYLNQIDNRKNDESGSNFLQFVNILNF